MADAVNDRSIGLCCITA